MPIDASLITIPFHLSETSAISHSNEGYETEYSNFSVYEGSNEWIREFNSHRCLTTGCTAVLVSKRDTVAITIT